MKFTCPHCQESAISALAKAVSAPYQPAKCPLCGGLSSEPHGLGAPVAILNGLAPYFLIAACVMFWSLWPVVAYLAFIGVYWAAHTIWQPLSPLSVVEVRSAKRDRWLMALGFLVFAAVVLWIGPLK